LSHLRGVWRTVCLSWFTCIVAHAAPAEDVMRMDLAPLIEAAASSPARFAVDVPHGAGTETHGEWSRADGMATWDYVVRVPSAISLSFRAVSANWPQSAVLTVTHGAETATYGWDDFRRGELWSRIAQGEVLALRITVPAADRARLSFAISSLQVGYRSITEGGDAHPRFRAMQAAGTAALATGSCIENYKCHEDANNEPQSRATVSLTIGNQYFCTGTLLNNTSNDAAPFILTARHCQGSVSNPAKTMRVMWDVTSACGAPQSSIYGPSKPSQVGATTRVEQQDSWLVELDELPVFANAYYAGWDATGASFIGGYSIHHATSLAQQFVRWYGQAVLTNQQHSSRTETHWALSNELGSVAPGASGAAIFDTSHRVVGALSRAKVENGAGVCPNVPPVAPTAGSYSASANAFFSVFDSTTDSSSGTGGATMRSFLDPASTGQRVVSGFAMPAGTKFTASDLYPVVTHPITLTWSAPLASSCTATGGFEGDGWSGPLPASGTKSISQTLGLMVTYGLDCHVGTRIQRFSVIVRWSGNEPRAGFLLPQRLLNWIGAPVTLQWSANVTPCTLSGGSLSRTTSETAGEITLTEQVPGSYTYSIQCGSGSTSATGSMSIDFRTPVVDLYAPSRLLRVGLPFTLHWSAAADHCVPSGGREGDGWTSSAYTGSGTFTTTAWIAGTFTYGLTCHSGAVTAYSELTVVSDDGPAFAELTVDPGPKIARQIWMLHWRSNVYGCVARVKNAEDGTEHVLSYVGGTTAGSVPMQPNTAGTYNFSLECPADSGGVNKVRDELSVQVTHDPPTVSLTSNVSEIAVGSRFRISWDIQNADSCEFTGDIASRSPPPIGPAKAEALFEATEVGTRTSSIQCRVAGVNGERVSVSVRVIEAPPAPPAPPSGGGGSSGGGSSSGGGGGGSLEISLVAFLAMLALASARRRQRQVVK